MVSVMLDVDPVIAAVVIGIWIRMERQLIRFERLMRNTIEDFKDEMRKMRIEMEVER